MGFEARIELEQNVQRAIAPGSNVSFAWDRYVAQVIDDGSLSTSCLHIYISEILKYENASKFFTEHSKRSGRVHYLTTNNLDNLALVLSSEKNRELLVVAAGICINFLLFLFCVTHSPWIISKRRGFPSIVIHLTTGTGQERWMDILLLPMSSETSLWKSRRWASSWAWRIRSRKHSYVHTQLWRYGQRGFSGRTESKEYFERDLKKANPVIFNCLKKPPAPFATTTCNDIGSICHRHFLPLKCHLLK